MDVRDIEASLIDGTIKGMPGGMAPIALRDVGRQGWNVLREDMPLPLAVLKGSALRHNGDWMRRFLLESGAVISPHGKTTMSPQLFALQIEDGAWAITVGSVQQLQVARRYGFDRVVMANQLVGARAIRYVLDEIARDENFDFFSLVDSVEQATRLAEAARAARLPRPLQLIVEGGFVGGRTGCRTFQQALEVARIVKAASPFLSLRGVGGYEGLLRSPDEDELDGMVRRFLDYLVDIAIACGRENLFGEGEVLLTAGGSTFYDLVPERFAKAGVTRPFKVLTRSGCYLTHDSGEYRDRFQQLRKRTPSIDGLGQPLVPALEVWAYVQSRPEPTKAILTAGKRDISFDSRLPQPLKWLRPSAGATAADIRPVGEGHTVTGLNDQHCHLALPEDSPLKVGDMVALGISHPCTTFDKWQVIPVVDDDYNIVSAVRTFF
ncbi:MAG: amino acid deaminase [Parvibaculaceae bacterium]